MFGIGDDYNVEKTAKKIFGAKKFFHTPYSKNTNTLFKRKMSKTFTTLDSHTASELWNEHLKLFSFLNKIIYACSWACPFYTIACRSLSRRSPAAVVLRRAPDRRAGGWRRARGRCGCLLLRWPRQDTPTTLAELRAAQAVGVEVIAAAQCKTTPTVGSFTPQMASIGSMDLRLGALTPQISLAVAAEAAAA